MYNANTVKMTVLIRWFYTCAQACTQSKKKKIHYFSHGLVYLSVDSAEDLFSLIPWSFSSQQSFGFFTPPSTSQALGQQSAHSQEKPLPNTAYICVAGLWIVSVINQHTENRKSHKNSVWDCCWNVVTTCWSRVVSSPWIEVEPLQPGNPHISLSSPWSSAKG